jgi:hypothetical protein
MNATSVLDNSQTASVIKLGTKVLGHQETLEGISGEVNTVHSTPQDKYLEVKSTPDRGLAVLQAAKSKRVP